MKDYETLKMLFAIGALLSILSLANSHLQNSHLQNSRLPNSRLPNSHLPNSHRPNNSPVDPVRDAELLNKIILIEKSNENLRLKMDTLNMTISRELAQLKNTSTSAIPSSCEEALRQSGRQNGTHKIRIPDSDLSPFYVYCLADPNQNGSAWTIVQRRIDGSFDFFRQWSDYVRGFGNLETEFFMGLERLHALTTFKLHELWIQMEDFENVKRFAKYSTFAIGNANESYALNVLGSFSGDAGDSLIAHAGMKFSTKDVDNDALPNENCALDHVGAWWYKACQDSNLNGQYLGGPYTSDRDGDGVDWATWHGHLYSLKYVHMAIRPRA